jgi:hypothetical protein
MGQTSQSLWFGAVFFLGAIECAAGEIRLDSGATLTVSDAQYSRTLPHAFHDQATSSLPHVFPQHVLLASRRSGVLGDVIYALVCFKETRSSERVVIQAVAVRGDRAWNLEAIAPLRYGDTLVQVLEQMQRLPADPGVPLTPASGRR